MGYDETTNENKFNYLWGWPSAADLVKRLQPGQMVNQMPGQVQMTRKDNLANTIQEFIRKYPQFNFIPKTFILPNNMLMCQSYMQQNPKKYFIVKEALANRGEGIQLLRGNMQIETQVEAVVQEYIKNPLLINGYKFDFRIYVVVLQVDPLIVYYYQEGIARFATTQYSKPTLKTINDKTVHLTNYSVNKNYMDDEDSDEIIETQIQQENFAFKQKMTTVIEHIQSNLYFASEIDIYKKIEEVIQATIIAAEPKMAAQALINRSNALPRKCFGMYGFDLILLNDGEFKLLEVNANPSTGGDTQVDFEVKDPLFRDLISLTQPKKYFVNDKLRVQQVADENETPREKDQRAFSQKIRDLKALYCLDESKFKIESSKILRNLSEYEEKLLKQLNIDCKKHGNFKRIIPNASGDYLEFFESAKYTDWLAAIAVKAKYIKE
ncbi:Tubulin_tyrosine ligase [Hexamita inflata]|uniref:Tubulin--tyrosine ligase-like protein 5 n=1 Tax=Hexamita inflata TaxID=28002 RepID=A0AA86V1B8_9EUKA|nr:Tubulin tyrosine ligase [Hexamita inflata]